MDYRHIARKAIKQAKYELDSGEEHRLVYASLELRMALEALTYERASLYSSELSGKKLSTWQPRILLNILLEIDPYVDKSANISFGKQEEYGKPAKKMTSLGKERVLSLKEIKEYYDRLGSYLHTPTIEQLAEGKGSSPEKIRIRCGEIYNIIDEVLSSPIFNFNLKKTSTITCDKCANKIVRRIPPDSESLIAKCINCSASYTLKVDRKQDIWIPNYQTIECFNPSCNSTFRFWENEIELGAKWSCKECKGINQIVYGVEFTEAVNNNDTKG